MSRIGCLTQMWGLFLGLSALFAGLSLMPVWFVIASALPDLDPAGLGGFILQLLGYASPLPVVALGLSWLLGRGSGTLVSMKAWLRLVLLYLLLGQGLGMLIAAVSMQLWATPEGLMLIAGGVAIAVVSYRLDEWIGGLQRGKVLRVRREGSAGRLREIAVEILASESAGRGNAFLTLLSWETPGAGPHSTCVLTTDMLYNSRENVALVATDRPDRLLNLVDLGERRARGAKWARSR